MKREIFVFGSNLAGRHSKGDALYAKNYYGAIYGQGAGLQGNSYAIPTKDGRLRSLPLKQIKEYVRRFIVFVYSNDLKKLDFKYKLTAVGCGLAGYTPEQIAPFFNKLLFIERVQFPKSFLDVYESKKLEENKKHFKSENDRSLLHQNIITMFNLGFNQTQIAKQLGVHQPTVCRYLQKYLNR